MPSAPRESPVSGSNIELGEEKACLSETAPVTDPSPSGFEALNELTSPRKLLLLGVFCLALFLDAFNNSALFVAIPPIAIQLNIPNSQSVWLLSGYQLTFAALLLIVRSSLLQLFSKLKYIMKSGRLSDLYNPSL